MGKSARSAIKGAKIFLSIGLPDSYNFQALPRHTESALIAALGIIPEQVFSIAHFLYILILYVAYFILVYITTTGWGRHRT